ncbi:Fic family protein [Nitrosarchaeum koreense]|nr:Fic family protein [Nitrosarchaeum koreense]
MVSVVKRKREDKTEYYLVYSSRGQSKEKFLGTSEPENIDNIKKEYEEISYREDKIPSLEKIKKNYSKHNETMDKKILDAENHGFKITHTYSTQRIEGSTMTLGQTRKLLEQKLSPKDTSTEDIIEAEQLAEIFDEMLSFSNDVSKKLILNWHDVLFKKTDTNNVGNFRRTDVQPYLGKTEYVVWDEVIPEIEKLVLWYNKNKKEMNPVELSARFHRRFELIHPFIDGNGRIGRLLMIFILHKNGYPMMNIDPKEKLTYINKLESSYLKDDALIFVKWFISKYLRDNKKFLK